MPPDGKEFTKCVDAKDYRGQNEYVQSTVAALLGTFGVTALLLALNASPGCYLCLVPVFADIWLIAYCRWALYDRLICLPVEPDPDCPDGNDQVAIGMLVRASPPDQSFGHTINPDPSSMDTDYTVSILLAPNQPGDTPEAKQIDETSSPYGYLLQEQSATRDRGLPFVGRAEADQATGEVSWILHCELEGAGYYDLLVAAQLGLLIAIAAFLTCCLVPRPIGLIVALILALLSLLIDYAGVIIGHTDQGSPADVGIGEFHHNNADGTGADILIIQGKWIYDSGHEGWNELHPVKHCQQIATWQGTWPSNIDELEKEWKAMLCNAGSTVVLENQRQPENEWQIHPVIDGCDPAVIV